VRIQGVILVFFSFLNVFFEVEYDDTYAFEVFISLASCTRDIPGVERDDEECDCPWTKLDGIVPARN